MSTTSYLVKATLYVLVLGIVVGCSAPRELNESAAAALLQRVTDRWRCLERNDVNCAYQYTSPGFRSVFSQKMYGFRDISTLKRRLTGARVVEYDAGAAVASVEVGVMSYPSKYAPSTSQALGVVSAKASESWIWLNGQWWISERK